MLWYLSMSVIQYLRKSYQIYRIQQSNATTEMNFQIFNTTKNMVMLNLAVFEVVVAKWLLLVVLVVTALKNRRWLIQFKDCLLFPLSSLRCILFLCRGLDLSSSFRRLLVLLASCR